MLPDRLRILSRIQTYLHRIHQSNALFDTAKLSKHFSGIPAFKKIKMRIAITQSLGKILSFLEATIAFKGMGRPRGFRRFRKTHLENILSRGSRDRDPRYPKGVPWDQNFFKKKFSQKVIRVYVGGFGGYYG